MRTKLISAGLAVVVILFIVVSMAMNGGVPVEAARVQVGSIREFVEERAKTRLPQVYAVTMPYDGRIGAIQLIEGSEVKQGQTVAQLVQQDVELAVRAAEAALEQSKAALAENEDVSVEETTLKQKVSQAESGERTVDAAQAKANASQAKLEYARKSLDRIRELRDMGAGTLDQYEQAQLAFLDAAQQHEADVMQLRSLQASQAATELEPAVIRQTIARKTLTQDVLEQQVAGAAVRHEQARIDAARSVLTSPVDGVVLERLVTDEKRTPAGTVLLTIGRMQDLEVEAEILSQEVVKVRVGDRVEISGPVIGSVPTIGTVQRIYPAGFMKISSLGVEQQRVRVIIGFDPAELSRLRVERGLGSEYRVRVRIITESRDNTLIVPRSALFRSANGEWQVFAIRDRRLVLQPVEIGLINDERVEIRSGVAEAEAVVLAPETNLAAGMTVQPSFREQQAPLLPVSDQD